MSAVVILLTILSSLLTLELIARATKLPRAVLRKVVHVGMSLIVAVAALVFGHDPFVIIGLVFTLLLLVLRGMFPLEVLSDRADESYGEIFFPLGVSFAAVFSGSVIDFVTVVLILGLADTVAYIVGKQVFSPEIIFGKTLLGSMAFFLITFLLCVWFTPLSFSLLVALTATIAELLSPRGYDNLTVPAVVTLAFLFVS